MKMRNVIIGIVILVILVAGGGVAFLQFTAGDGEASQDIGDVAETVDNVGEATVFSIVSEESEASFTLDEDLVGVRTTVVGTTNQVGGEIALNLASPSASSVGTITINARTLTTDNDFRNQAIRSRILRSSQDQYEFITFVPTSLNGLPETAEVGETYTIDIIGDLTIIDTTNEVTFTTEVTIVSETEITGSATSTITYGDWGIPIPTAPSVANVDEDVVLAINFIARAGE